MIFINSWGWVQLCSSIWALLPPAHLWGLLGNLWHRLLSLFRGKQGWAGTVLFLTGQIPPWNRLADHSWVLRLPTSWASISPNLKALRPCWCCDHVILCLWTFFWTRQHAFRTVQQTNGMVPNSLTMDPEWEAEWLPTLDQQGHYIKQTRMTNQQQKFMTYRMEA